MNTISAPFPEHIRKYVDRVGSRKRKAFVYEREAGTAISLYSYWDSGSRDLYQAWDANDRPIPLPISGAPGFTQERGKWTPQPGDVLVEYGTCMGKPSTPAITFYR